MHHREKRALALRRRPSRGSEERHAALERAVRRLEDADDRVTRPVDRDRAPEHRRVAAESTPPVRSRQHRDAGRRRLSSEGSKRRPSAGFCLSSGKYDPVTDLADDALGIGCRR